MNPQVLVKDLSVSGFTLLNIGSSLVSSAVVSAMMRDAFYLDKLSGKFVTGKPNEIAAQVSEMIRQYYNYNLFVIFVGLSPAHVLSRLLSPESKKSLIERQAPLLFVSKAFSYQDGIATKGLVEQGYQADRIRLVPLANRAMLVSDPTQPLTRPLLATSQLLDGVVSRSRSVELEFAELHSMLLEGARYSPSEKFLPALEGNYGHIAVLYRYGVTLEDCSLLNDALDEVILRKTPSALLQGLYELTRERPLELGIPPLFSAYRFALYLFPGLENVADDKKFHNTLAEGEQKVFDFLQQTRQLPDKVERWQQRARALQHSVWGGWYS